MRSWKNSTDIDLVSGYGSTSAHPRSASLESSNSTLFLNPTPTKYYYAVAAIVLLVLTVIALALTLAFQLHLYDSNCSTTQQETIADAIDAQQLQRSVTAIADQTADNARALFITETLQNASSSSLSVLLGSGFIGAELRARVGADVSPLIILYSQIGEWSADAPSINSNVSGVAAALSILFAMAALTSTPQYGEYPNRVRAVFSTTGRDCVSNGTDIGTFDDKTAVLINLCTVGSPNAVFAVYNSSATLEGLYATALTNVGVKYKSIAYEPVEALVNVIPAIGGAFSGTLQVKSESDRALFGGLLNVSYDPCNRRACDTVDGVNLDVMFKLTIATAQVLERLARDANLMQTLNAQDD